jgi:hypothetical protein
MAASAETVAGSQERPIHAILRYLSAVNLTSGEQIPPVATAAATRHLGIDRAGQAQAARLAAPGRG